MEGHPSDGGRAFQMRIPVKLIKNINDYLINNLSNTIVLHNALHLHYFNNLTISAVNVVRLKK